jgi:hypothetical protein
MALTTSVKVTNHTSSTHKEPDAYDLGETTNYIFVNKSDSKQQTLEMSNRTVNTDMYGEKITSWYKETKTFDSPLMQYVNSPVDGCVQFAKQVDMMVITDDDANPMTGEVRDLCQTIIIQKYTKSPYMTAALLDECKAVALSEYYDELGNSLTGNFMRGSINPKDF